MRMLEMRRDPLKHLALLLLDLQGRKRNSSVCGYGGVSVMNGDDSAEILAQLLGEG